MIRFLLFLLLDKGERARRRLAFAESNRPEISRTREGKLVEVQM